jgi:phage baseplate assembly protein W
MMKDFLGTGWAFPVQIDAHGRIALAHQERDIEEAIRIILLTPKGQRMMRPEFGCQIHDLLFASDDASTAGLAAYYVEEALGMWEPRIRVLEANVQPDFEHRGRLLIDITYEIKATHDRRSLVFPFYHIPGEPESDLPDKLSNGRKLA